MVPARQTPMTRSTHHPAYVAFLKMLREERQQRGITQVELAKRLGNRQTFVSKLESGERRLDVVELFEFLEHIGSDPLDFLSRLRTKLRGATNRKNRKLAIRQARVKQEG